MNSVHTVKYIPKRTQVPDQCVKTGSQVKVTVGKHERVLILLMAHESLAPCIFNSYTSWYRGVSTTLLGDKGREDAVCIRFAELRVCIGPQEEGVSIDSYRRSVEVRKGRGPE